MSLVGLLVLAGLILILLGVFKVLAAGAITIGIIVLVIGLVAGLVYNSRL